MQLPPWLSFSCLLFCSGYLPPPIHSSQLAQRLLQQQKYERLDEGGEVQEIEMELEESEPEAAATENKEMVGSSGVEALYMAVKFTHDVCVCVEMIACIIVVSHCW